MFKLKGKIAPDCSCDERDVLALKRKLMAVGYLADGELNRDGIPHQEMFEALARFQADHDIEEAGL